MDRKRDAVIRLGRFRIAAQAQSDPAVETSYASIALLIILMLAAVIKTPSPFTVSDPSPLFAQVTILLTSVLDLVARGEVSICFHSERKRSGLLGVIGHVDVFVHSLANHTRDSELNRLLQSITIPAFRRGLKVIAKPAMLLDSRLGA